MKDVRDFLVGLLEDRECRVLGSLVRALKDFEDAQAAPTLREFAAKTADVRLSKDARMAAEALVRPKS